MSQNRTFTLELKNGQTLTLNFNPIEATGDRLWQMFATTEALDTVDQIISLPMPSTITPTKVRSAEVTDSKKTKNK